MAAHPRVDAPGPGPHDHDHDDHHDDHHDHHHDHDGGWWSRAAHALGDVFGAHSHDAADQVDEALEAHAEGRRALVISLVALLVTAALQGLVVAVSGSVALLGDTLHNVADALTAVPLLIAFRLALRPATRRFTYGYGRAEDVAGIFIVAMIALSSALAAFEAARRLLHPQDVTHLWAVAVAAVIGFAGNELVAVYRIRVGRRIGSAALVADGLHARTDGVTSLAVLLGVGGSALGWQLADPVVGLAITVAILGILRSAAREVGARLMDAVDPDLVDRTRAALAQTPGVTDVAELRMRWVGHTLRAEAAITVAPHLDVAEAHRVAHAASDAARQRVRRLTDVLVHTGPTATTAPAAPTASDSR